MNHELTQAGYEATKRKLTDVERRLARLAQRTDLSAVHRDEVKWTYEQMISQYWREIKLYEAGHSGAVTKS